MRLLDQAKRNASHISAKAVMDEYDRLLAEKLRPKGLFARLFSIFD
jgi:hypothetical protein